MYSNVSLLERIMMILLNDHDLHQASSWSNAWLAIHMPYLAGMEVGMEVDNYAKQVSLPKARATCYKRTTLGNWQP